MSEAETQFEPVAPATGASDQLYLGDAIHFFLSAKRAGGRSERTIDDYRKKLALFQRWLARRIGGEDAVDARYIDIGADEVELYVDHLKEARGSRPNQDARRGALPLRCSQEELPHQARG